MYNGTLILISLLFASSVFAQPTLQWARTYNGPANDRDAAGSIVVDDSGYVYVNGVLKGLLTNDRDYCTIKYKPNGDTSWVRIYSRAGDSSENSTEMKVDAFGNVYVTGYPATIKYDRFGSIVWTVTSTIFAGFNIELDATGNIYVGGNSINKFTLKKYTNAGTQLWSTTFDDGGGGYVKDMALDKFGNIILVGEMAYSGTYRDFFTIKFNSSGDTLWSRSYNGACTFPAYDWANAVAADDTGNIYVTGMSSDMNCNVDYLTVKYDSSGNEKWMKRYSGGIAYDIEVDKSGNVFVAGVTGLSSYTLLKYGNSGNLLWSATTPAYSFAVGVSITLDSAGNVYLAGARTRNSWSDLMIIKYNTNGIQQWIALYPGVGNSINEAYDITIDKMGNVYATGKGYLSGTFTESDFLTVKYSQTIGITPISNELPNNFSLLQNYPNPFNPNTIIRFSLRSPSDKIKYSGLTTLKVFDVLGKDVATLVNEQLNPGTYEVNWNASNFPSGVYFYKLITDGKIIDTKKMILLR